MIKKKSLILSLVVILLNFPTQSFSYSLNNFQQLATSNQEPGTGSSGSSNENSNGESGEGQNGGEAGDSTGEEDGNLNVTDPVNDSVELEGTIGHWDPNNNGFGGLDVDGSRPQSGQYFTISATVPLQMDFLIQNENENGSSPNGKFITPYYKVKNNGSYPLNIEVESFGEAKSTRSSDLIDQKLEKLYVAEPESKNGKVEMRLNLTYDRPSNSYFKKVDLHNLNKRSEVSSRALGMIDPNEEARLYYGSDLWETPKSEGIQTGVEATFKLKLAFSLQKDTSDNTDSDANNGTEGEGSGENGNGNGTTTQ